MDSVPVAQPSPPAGFHSSRRALALTFAATAAILAAAIAASFTWPSGSKVDRPDWFAAGAASTFETGQPVHFPDQEFWLVRRGETGFLALYDKDPHLGCTVPWRSEFEFMGHTGWFRNPCHGETYDLDGRCVSGPCPRGLDRFRTRVVNGQVMVDTARMISGPERQSIY